MVPRIPCMEKKVAEHSLYSLAERAGGAIFP